MCRFFIRRSSLMPKVCSGFTTASSKPTSICTQGSFVSRKTFTQFVQTMRRGIAGSRLIFLAP
jgi:hypothetical protein